MIHVTTTSALCRAFIVAWEGGYRLQSYLCPAGYWTISAGVTRMPDGRKVKAGDQVSLAEAKALFETLLGRFEADVDAVTNDDITQAHFDALVSFAWNLGVPNLASSTLLRLVNSMRSPTEIKLQFERWCFADIDPDKPGLEKVPGLLRRRTAEATIYGWGRYEGPDGKPVRAET